MLVLRMLVLLLLMLLLMPVRFRTAPCHRPCFRTPWWKRAIGCVAIGVIKHGRDFLQQAEADRHEQEHEQEQDKHAQHKQGHGGKTHGRDL